MDYQNCTLCPRQCGVNRTAGETGFCGCPDRALVAKTMLHKWEEPVLAGSGGSGAIFFGGCTLGCKYCQNRAISTCPIGTPMDSKALRAEMEKLIAQGAENIDLVTPTQYLPTIIITAFLTLSATLLRNLFAYFTGEILSLLFPAVLLSVETFLAYLATGAIPIHRIKRIFRKPEKSHPRRRRRNPFPIKKA